MRDPRRGQLDRERDAVQPAADLGHRGAFASVQREVRAAPARARSTNSRTASLDQRLARSADRVARRQRQRRHRRRSSRPATPSASRLVASTRSVGAAAQQRARRARRAASSTCSQLSSTTSARRVARCSVSVVERRAPRLVAHAERGGDRLGDALGLGERRQVDEPHAVRDARRQRARRARSASRVLPEPPAPVSVSSRASPEQRRDALGELALAAHEARSPGPAGCAAWPPRSPARSAAARRIAERLLELVRARRASRPARFGVLLEAAPRAGARTRWGVRCRQPRQSTGVRSARPPWSRTVVAAAERAACRSGTRTARSRTRRRRCARPGRRPAPARGSCSRACRSSAPASDALAGSRRVPAAGLPPGPGSRGSTRTGRPGRHRRAWRGRSRAP